MYGRKFGSVDNPRDLPKYKIDFINLFRPIRNSRNAPSTVLVLP